MPIILPNQRQIVQNGMIACGFSDISLDREKWRNMIHKAGPE